MFLGDVGFLPSFCHQSFCLPERKQEELWVHSVLPFSQPSPGLPARAPLRRVQHSAYPVGSCLPTRANFARVPATSPNARRNEPCPGLQRILPTVSFRQAGRPCDAKCSRAVHRTLATSAQRCWSWGHQHAIVTSPASAIAHPTIFTSVASAGRNYSILPPARVILGRVRRLNAY